MNFLDKIDKACSRTSFILILLLLAFIPFVFDSMLELRYQFRYAKEIFFNIVIFLLTCVFIVNLLNQKKTLKETKQVKFTLYNPQFDIYISGKGTNGTQYLNMMGMFGGDKKTGIILMPKGLHTWTLQESTQPKMVNGTPYGTALPPGQYQVYAEGAGLKSNEVKITIKKN